VFRFFANDSLDGWNATDQWVYVVGQTAPVCTLTGLTNHTYGTNDTAVCSCDNGGGVHLYRDGAEHDEWNNTAVVFGAGDYEWVCNTTGTGNYTTGTIDGTFLTDTTNFNTNLSSTDTDVQTALETLDDASFAVFGLWSIDTDGNMMPITTVSTDTYWELDGDDNLIPKS